jgi:hypothetical protein
MIKVMWLLCIMCTSASWYSRYAFESCRSADVVRGACRVEIFYEDTYATSCDDVSTGRKASSDAQLNQDLKIKRVVNCRLDRHDRSDSHSRHV